MKKVYAGPKRSTALLEVLRAVALIEREELLKAELRSIGEASRREEIQSALFEIRRGLEAFCSARSERRSDQENRPVAVANDVSPGLGPQDDSARSTEDLLEEYSEIVTLTGRLEHAVRVRNIMDELVRRGAFSDRKPLPKREVGVDDC
jgi:hypothetical protein